MDDPVDLSDKQAAAIVAWGKGNPMMDAIHLFGSRAKGTSGLTVMLISH
jgi:hypothetical protein